MKKKLTKQELIQKIGVKNFALVERNVFCAECGNTAIVDYEDDIVLEPSRDTVLRGKCKKCGHAVARVLETGEER
ncbi:hypothetical protein KKF64_02065 [Patescibacteria group bacterium]|nr:hypothetical protein [Patescibacteria group bacterium]